MEIIRPPSATHGLGRINYYRRENRCRNTNNSDERQVPKERGTSCLGPFFIFIHWRVKRQYLSARGGTDRRYDFCTPCNQHLGLRKQMIPLCQWDSFPLLDCLKGGKMPAFCCDCGFVCAPKPKSPTVHSGHQHWETHPTSSFASAAKSNSAFEEPSLCPCGPQMKQ